MQKAGGTRNLGLYGKELGISNNGKMSESITFGSVHQKRRARAQPLRHARASCRESRFQAEKEIGGQAAISVTLADQNPYLIRRRRSADEVVTVRRDGVEDHLDQIAWRAGLFMVNGGNTANDFRIFDQRQPSCSTLPEPGLFISHKVLYAEKYSESVREG